MLRSPRRRRWLDLPLLVILCSLASCRDRTPPAPPEKSPAARSSLSVKPGADLIFTYLGLDGRFHSTAKLEEIPARSRLVVRVVDPKRPPGQRDDAGRVYVADLSRPGAHGAYVAKLMDRDVFESAAQAQLPPGEGSQFAFDRPPGGPGPGMAPLAPVAPNRDRVILYGTSWCGACAKARAYLKQHGIRFEDKDVEHDRAAAAELVAKAARAGIRPDRVPILDVRGTLIQGFDEKRLEALLGVPI